MVRDPVTGRFVAHAVGAVFNNSPLPSSLIPLIPIDGIPLQPFISPIQPLLSGLQIYQTHRGFTAVLNGLSTIESSLKVLQATTAVIGVGTAVGVVLSAVNLHQTLKLRQDIKQLRLEVKDGFIDLKQALKHQGTEIIKRIDQIALDVEFRNHRTILVQAYGLFTQALHRLRLAMQLQDVNRRNAEIDGARGMLFEALKDYATPHLLQETCAAGYLRRVECAWVIDQTIAMTYQLQNEPAAVSDHLSLLQGKIREDSLDVIKRCESEDELDFLFPEITRIHGHDLAVLESWQNHVDWIQTLSNNDQQLLASSDLAVADSSDSSQNPVLVVEPEEQSLYKNLKQKSHYLSLRDQLQFIVKPDLRQTHESYISQQAIASSYKALAPSNWQEVPNLTVANLYWYFKVRDDGCVSETF